MGYVRGDDPRISQAKLYTNLPCVMSLGGAALLAIAATLHLISINGPLYARWWQPVLSAVFAVLYGIAGWRIGHRDPRGGWLALALFGWRLAADLWTGHLVTVGALYATIGILLIWRAAEPLRLRAARVPPAFRRPVA
jgi:hypothetical protein